MDIELINWAKDGTYRIKVLKLLSTKPLLSSELANELGIHRASMSRILKLLRERKLVRQVSGKTRTVTYIITDKGLEVLRTLEGVSNT